MFLKYLYLYAPANGSSVVDFWTLVDTLHGMKPECNDAPLDNVFIIF